MADGSHSLFLDSPERFLGSPERFFWTALSVFLNSPERGGNVRCAPRTTSERPALLNGVTAF